MNILYSQTCLPSSESQYGNEFKLLHTSTSSNSMLTEHFLAYSCELISSWSPVCGEIQAALATNQACNPIGTSCNPLLHRCNYNSRSNREFHSVYDVSRRFCTCPADGHLSFIGTKLSFPPLSCTHGYYPEHIWGFTTGLARGLRVSFIFSISLAAIKLNLCASSDCRVCPISGAIMCTMGEKLTV